MSRKSKGKANKTNAMRILDRLGIPYEYQEYEEDGFIDGIEVAEKLGLDKGIVFKTLVTVSPGDEHFVFVIPVDRELDLKKCAKAAGVKSVAMIHVKELEPLTGYIRGGCTAIGMKKDFPVFLDASAEDHDRIYISGGKRGSQIALSPDDFIKATNGAIGSLTKE